MPAQSQQQQKLFGLALSVKRGETPRSEASNDVLNIVDTMTEKEIKDFAETSHKGLPKKVEETIREMVRETISEAGVAKMFKTFLAVQKKVKDLEASQKELLSQWKSEKDPKKKSALLDKMKKGTVTLKKTRANLSNIESQYINNMSYDTSYSESVHEGEMNERYVKTRGFKETADRIERLSKSLRPDSILCKNISKNADNVVPEFKKMQKHMNEIYSLWEEVEYTIGMSNETLYSESINEGASNEEKRIVMMAIKKIAKYRNVPLNVALIDTIRAAEELERTIKK